MALVEYYQRYFERRNDLKERLPEIEEESDACDSSEFIANEMDRLQQELRDLGRCAFYEPPKGRLVVNGNVAVLKTKNVLGLISLQLRLIRELGGKV